MGTKNHLSGGGAIEQSNDIEKSAFPRAGGTDKSNELSCTGSEVDTVERTSLHDVAILLDDVPNHDDGLRRLDLQRISHFESPLPDPVSRPDGPERSPRRGPPPSRAPLPKRRVQYRA